VPWPLLASAAHDTPGSVSLVLPGPLLPRGSLRRRRATGGRRRWGAVRHRRRVRRRRLLQRRRTMPALRPDGRRKGLRPERAALPRWDELRRGSDELRGRVHHPRRGRGRARRGALRRGRLRRRRSQPPPGEHRGLRHRGPRRGLRPGDLRLPGRRRGRRRRRPLLQRRGRIADLRHGLRRHGARGESECDRVLRHVGQRLRRRHRRGRAHDLLDRRRPRRLRAGGRDDDGQLRLRGRDHLGGARR
jgi:hypothetical protein